MNSKDYKKIAEIMKESNVLDINKQSIFMISHKLADYFEKIDEDSKGQYLGYFDKIQFLKDCGVEQ